MDALFNEEEELLRASVAGQVRRLPQTVQDIEQFDDVAFWSQLAQGGLLGLGLPEDVGGAGTSSDLGIVVHELAAGLAAVPYVGCVFAVHLLAAAGAPAATIAPILAGERRIAVALGPTLQEVARTDDGGGAVAWDAAGAGAALTLDTDGRLVALALAEPADRFDLTRDVRPCLRAALDVGDLGGVIGADALATWTSLALAVIAADLAGTMKGALRLATDYVQGREQFGVPIGSFQAVQHLLADAHVSAEGARSSATYALWTLDHRDRHPAPLAIQTAKAYASEAGKQVCEAVVQVHGGMAMTWECLAHLYLRRALGDRVVLGDENVHFRAIASARRVA